ncbi:MAG TPA: hypothetical protein VNA16_02570 [Abditibacteriaceae bacterium]|nr:hypothetical protein [Abditibacteriaceae bacterium]
MNTYDCAPTLTDSQVLEFCKNGFLLLEGVVPRAINERTTEYLEVEPGMEPTGILKEEWFVENVICNPHVAGAVRSLLGANFHLPVLMSNHRRRCPSPVVGGWHVDGGSLHDGRLHYLQVFYYPQDTPLALGPTELLPGSHFMLNQQRFMAHYGRIRGALSSAAPAGSIFLTVYSIWHRAGTATAHGLRNLLKYFYWRTVPPQRDWVREPDFDFAHANDEIAGPQYGEQFRACRDAAALFLWLCGKSDGYAFQGGQAWPIPARRLSTPFGMPAGLE